MAAQIINLRQARKAKARSEKERTADENRRLHGRTNAQKKADTKSKADANKHLDGHHLDGSHQDGRREDT